MKTVTVLVFLFMLPMAFAQKDCDSIRLERFHVDSLSSVFSWIEYPLDPKCSKCTNYIADQEKHFAALGFITLDSAMRIACETESFVVDGAVLRVADNKTNTVWAMRGPQEIKLGGRGYGNADVLRKVLSINAITGEIIGIKTEKGRALVHF